MICHSVAARSQVLYEAEKLLIFYSLGNYREMDRMRTATAKLVTAAE